MEKIKPMDVVRDVWHAIDTYVWFVLIALFGGVANYIVKLKENNKKAFSTVELLGELVLSGFTGLMTAYICKAEGLSFELTAAAVGIAGHMGARGIYIIEQILIERFSVSKKK